MRSGNIFTNHISSPQTTIRWYESSNKQETRNKDSIRIHTKCFGVGALRKERLERRRTSVLKAQQLAECCRGFHKVKLLARRTTELTYDELQLVLGVCSLEYCFMCQ